MQTSPPDENANCKPAVIQRAFDGGNSACIGEGKCGGAVQTIGKAAIFDRFSRKAFQTENGIISLAPQQVALQPLLESVVEQYAAKASEKGLSLQLQDTDTFAVFDFKWTAEALANIVDNAIKYTEHGTITISAVSYEMFARIDISDTGSGIPETEQAKIFARFYRSNSVQKQEGVGIGLYLARQIISGEGGYIKVASVPGKGSTFSIFLPK